MNNVRKILLILGLSFALLPMATGAAGMGDLYAAEVKAGGDNTGARNAALSAALAKVLVRLGGSRSVTTQPGARAMLEQAPSLVQQFKFRLQDKPGDAEDEPAGGQYFLWAKFDKRVVDRLMRQHGLAVWGRQRPRVLLWLAVEKQARRHMFSLESDDGARRAVLAEAFARGMPLQLPLMDLEDQSRLTAADLWSDYQDGIRSASARYPHDVVLSGRLRALGDGRWQGRWGLQGAQGSESFETGSLPWYQALVAGISRAQDELATRYGPVSGDDSAERVRVLFTEVVSLAGYGRLMAILRSQEAVTRLALRQVGDDRYLIDLWVRGGREALARSLELAAQLEPGVAEDSSSLPAGLPALPYPPSTQGGQAALGAGPDNVADATAASAAVELSSDLNYRLLD